MENGKFKMAKWETQEEKLTDNYLAGFLNGHRSEKKREPQRKLMAERRKQGLTQKAAREYIERNKTAVLMYGDLVRMEPELVRKGKHNFGRGA